MSSGGKEKDCLEVSGGGVQEVDPGKDSQCLPPPCNDGHWSSRMMYVVLDETC